MNCLPLSFYQLTQYLFQLYLSFIFGYNAIQLAIAKQEASASAGPTN